ncbi:MAG: ABC transporter ATP-binding protein [Clostridia bacterium]|nr:ABC transporter ATP-binding protein [Clostridia bacterium]
MIKVLDIKKTYYDGEIKCEALKGVSFDIPDGQFVSIVGKSGSGKSTLMHMLGALDNLTEGQIFVGEDEISKLDSRQSAKYRNKKIGYIFQSFFLEPTYTVFKNVEMPMIIGGVPKSERKKRVEKALETVGLLPKIKNKANKLSGGEKQRVSIARAIVNDPDIILADEPCGNLDTQNSANIMALLRELAKSGKTVILITHNPDDAKKTDRIITLVDGLVVSDALV